MQNYIFFQQNEMCEKEGELESNAGSWSLDQNLSYAIFVDLHKKSMTSKKKMREIQFYDKLSSFVGTRTSAQCRSHHQKLFDKFKYISKIIELFKTEAGISNYKLKYLDGIEKMKIIDHKMALKQTNSTIEHLQITQNFNKIPETVQPSPVLLMTYSYSPIGFYATGSGWAPVNDTALTFPFPGFITL